MTHLMARKLNIKYSSWKLTYRCQFETHRNWIRGRLIRPKMLCIWVLKTKLQMVLSGDRVLLPSGGRFDLIHLDRSKSALNEIIFLQSFIETLVADEDILLAGVGVRSGHVYDLGAEPIDIWPIGYLTGHTAKVMCLALKDGICVSGSCDNDLRIWNIAERVTQTVLVGHTSTVSHVLYDGHKIVSGSIDGSVRVWIRETGECLLVLTDHTNEIKFLQFDNGRIVSC